MVELIPKKQEIRLPRGLEALFFISIGVFVLVVSAFGVLTLLTRAAEEDLQQTKVAITQERTPERLRMEADLKAYAQKIDDFSDLLAVHYDTRKFFAEFERSTHPRVWFSEISLDFTKFTAKLSGTAETFYALGQQIAILEQDRFLKNVNLSDLGLSREGGVQFSLDFSFDPKLFHP